MDLGLPSGIRWAAYNIGAITPEGYGNYRSLSLRDNDPNYAWYLYFRLGQPFY